MRIPAFPVLSAGRRRRATTARRPATRKATRTNPVSKTAKYHHYTARPAPQFSSIRTITRAQADSKDLKAMVQRIRGRKHHGGTASGSRPGLSMRSRGIKIRVGKFKTSVKRGRPVGKTGKPLAWGIQSILVPKPASKIKKAPARKRTATRKKAAKRVRRKNPGRLMVLNPLPKHIERFRNNLTPAERAEFDKALRRFTKFHGGAFPSKVAKVGQAPGKQKRFLVGMGKAKEVGYEANKGYAGSNKNGTAWLHQFKGNPHMATTPDGKQILVLNQSGARRRFKVTDWVRG